MMSALKNHLPDSNMWGFMQCILMFSPCLLMNDPLSSWFSLWKRSPFFGDTPPIESAARPASGSESWMICFFFHPLDSLVNFSPKKWMGKIHHIFHGHVKSKLCLVEINIPSPICQGLCKFKKTNRLLVGDFQGWVWESHRDWTWIHNGNVEMKWV